MALFSRVKGVCAGEGIVIVMTSAARAAMAVASEAENRESRLFFISVSQLSPISSKPASDYRIKTSHFYSSRRFEDGWQGFFIGSNAEQEAPNPDAWRSKRRS
jgi:hypothetical protein